MITVGTIESNSVQLKETLLLTFCAEVTASSYGSNERDFVQKKLGSRFM